MMQDFKEGFKPKKHRIIIDLPSAELHRKFRIKTFGEGVYMKDLITKWIKEYLEGKKQ